MADECQNAAAAAQGAHRGGVRSAGAGKHYDGNGLFLRVEAAAAGAGCSGS